MSKETFQELSELLPTTLSQMNRRNLQGESLPDALGRIPPAVQTVRALYRSEDNFLALFMPDKQIAYTRNLDKAFRGNAPTLDLLAAAFGKAARDSWLDVQITELAAFSGCKDKFTICQLGNLIEIISEEYGNLKVTELMYFFRRFKAGDYGKFYGAVDPLVITCALKLFMDDRRTILSRLKKIDDEEKVRNSYENLVYSSKYEDERRMNRFYGINFKSKDFTVDEFREIWWLFNLGYESSSHGYREW